jgi:hypothetical protein
MSILDLFRGKTVAAYKPEEVCKGSTRALDGPRLVKLLCRSFEKLSLQEMLASEETVKQVLACLASDVFLRTLPDEDVETLEAMAPRLIELHRKAPLSVQVEVSELLHHLKNPAAAPFMLEKLRELSSNKETMLDRQAALVLSATVRYFILIPDSEALEPLLVVYRRAKNLFMESNLSVDPQNFRIWSLQAMCEIGKKDPVPRLLEFLQKLEKSQSPDRGLAKEILVSIESGQVAAAVTGEG